MLILDALLAEGASATMVAAAVRASVAAQEAEKKRRLEKQAERTRKSRALKQLSQVVAQRNVTDDDTALRAVTDVTEPPSPKETSPTPPKETTPSPNLATLGFKSGARWLEFIAIYPKRIEKRAAEAKFVAIVKSGVDPQILIDGARRYAEAMLGTEAQYIKSPVVWLNKGCWDDEHAAYARAGPNGSKFDATDMLAKLGLPDEPNRYAFDQPGPAAANPRAAGLAGELPQRDRGDRRGPLLDLRASRTDGD